MATYQEIIKSSFEKEARKEFVMILMRIDGKDYAKFYNFSDVSSPEEVRLVFKALEKQFNNTLAEVGGGGSKTMTLKKNYE